MKKLYDTDESLNKPKNNVLQIDYAKVAINFVQSLNIVDIDGLKLGHIPPMIFERFMSKLGLEIAKALIKAEPTRYGKHNPVEVAMGFSPDFRKEVEMNVRKNIISLYNKDINN